jgi:hypothetical protein
MVGFVVPVTVAVNCWVWPTRMSAEAGDTVMVISSGMGAGAGLLDPPEHPVVKGMERSARLSARERMPLWLNMFTLLR